MGTRGVPRIPRLRDREMELKGWLTVKKAADAVGMSRSSIYRLVEAGTIKSAKVGSSLYVSRESLKSLALPGSTL